MDELHLPWSTAELEALLLKVINTGETDKVDFKRQLNVSTAAEKAELVKDIASIANTYSRSYQNHGFIILGAHAGGITPTTFAQPADALQATIDEILRNNVGPFIPTQVRYFGPDAERWGVIVVLPSTASPHVFIRDMHQKARGDVFVRRGTITEKADPTDYPRFFRVHLEEQGHEQRESMRALQRDFANLRKEIRSLRTQARRAAPQAATKRVSSRGDGVQDSRPVPEPVLEPVVALGVLDAIDTALKKDTDAVSQGLMDEAVAIQTFLESDKLPWDLNNLSRDNGPEFVAAIERQSETFWLALARVIDRDATGRYDDAIVRAIMHLAREADPPAGKPFTAFGTGIRQYPLVMALYIVFVLGVAQKRLKLVRRVSTIELSRRSYYEEPLAIAHALFSVRRAAAVFQTRREDYPRGRWCDAVATSIREWFDRFVFAEGSSWDHNRHYFYIGEFLLSLVAAATPAINHPAQGHFLYADESAPVIRRFLQAEKDVLNTLLGSRLRDALTVFDEQAPRLAHAGNCWGDGFQQGAVEAVFPSSPTT